MPMPGPAAYTAILLGACTGALAKGITGFGSAILMALCWVMFQTFGADAGTLQDAVVTDCICGLCASLPLLWMTKAHRTTDWRLVTTLLIFKNLLSPVGSWMLVVLNKRVVELVMGCMLLVVIFLTTLPDIKKALARLTGHQPEESKEQSTQTADGGGSDEESLLSKTAHKDVIASPAEQDAADITTMSVDVIKQSSHQTDQLQHQVDDSPLVFQISASSVSCPAQHGFASSLFINQLPAAASQPGSTSPKPQTSSTLQPAAAEELTDIPLLEGSQQRSDAAGSSATGGAATEARSWKARWAHFRQRAKAFFADRENRRVLVWGCCAGAASGICEGLTGIGGPPIMVMYLKLGTPRDIARGTGAMSGVFQMRIFAYAAMGLIKKEFAMLYSIAAVAHVVLMLAGGLLLYRFVSQAAFGRCLLGLMSICCLLLFAAAADIGGKHRHG